MPRKIRKYNKVLSFGATSEQIDRLQKISKLTGKKVSAVVRSLIDSALPDVEPDNKFWEVCKNSDIFKVNLPANTTVPFIASFLSLPVSGKNEIDGEEIPLYAPKGLSPILWGLKRIEEKFHEKSSSVSEDRPCIPQNSRVPAKA